MTRLLFLAATLLLAGCALKAAPPTQSRESGALVRTGEYADEQLSTNLFRVTFRGNAALSDMAASDLNLLHSAEVALKNGYRYFVIVLPDTRRTRNGFINYVFAAAPTLTHGSDEFGDYPLAVSMIECFKDKLTTPYGKVYDAETLVQSLRGKYGVTK